jgi:hypothetical protein
MVLLPSILLSGMWMTDSEMVFRTKSGSSYEIIVTEQKIRRLHGEAPGTPRQGKDGEYKRYISLFPEVPTVGKSLMIFWDPVTNPLLEASDSAASPTTITSPIVSIVKKETMS